jgi:integrase/recombinase XerD
LAFSKKPLGDIEMTAQLTVFNPTEIYDVSNQSHSQEILIQMWLHGKSNATKRLYNSIAQRFLRLVNVPLDGIGLIHIQQFSDSLGKLTKGTQKTYICVIKSLVSFLHNLGVTRTNPGKAVKPPKSTEAINERILTVEEVQALIGAAGSDRNKLIIKVLYSLGLRAAELCGMQWRHLVQRKTGGQATVTGKGDKTRVVLIPQQLWDEINSLRGDDSDYVFQSRKGSNGGKLDTSAVWKMVKACAKSIGIPNLSPHWLRHSHASHSLDNGCPIHLLSASLGHSSVSTTSRYLHARPDESSSLFLSVG